MAHASSVLFVCLGNICRSPLAEGICRSVLAERGVDLRVDSCGTGGWHVGESPDPRSVQVAKKNGIDISGQRARQLAPEDYSRFSYLVAMDQSNAREIRRRMPSSAREDLVVVEFMRYVPNARGMDVPDPYYGGPGGFDHVFSLLESGMGPLLDEVIGG